VWFVAVGVEHVVQLSAKSIYVGNDVEQVNPFRLVPNVFDRVQVTCVRWKAFQKSDVARSSCNRRRAAR
jgi:hypothetical protein